jgi:S1-C subfamily serine protease
MPAQGVDFIVVMMRICRRSPSRAAGPVATLVVAAATVLPPGHWSAEARGREVAQRGDLAAEERATIDIFERSKGSVDHISTRERVVDFWTRNVLTIPHGRGSGFVRDEQGDIVTNCHVIADAAEARMRLADGREFAATLVGASRMHDLAVLHIDVPSDRPGPLPLGSSRDLRVGQRLYAIGNPFGLDWSLSMGIVSALDRSLSGDGGSVEHLIQTDAAINPGNSGGPPLDSVGRLVGVNTAIYSPSGASAGIGFAVPVDTVNRVVPELIVHGKYLPPTLGADIGENLQDALAARLGVEGVPVLKVLPGSPAAAAGLGAARIGRDENFAPGDIIVAAHQTRRFVAPANRRRQCLFAALRGKRARRAPLALPRQRIVLLGVTRTLGDAMADGGLRADPGRDDRTEPGGNA